MRESLLEGWLRAWAQPARREDVKVEISKEWFQLAVLEGSRILEAFPVSLGRARGDKRVQGDLKTPEGVFTIVAIEDAGDWEHDFGDGKGPVKGAYGPWFLRLSTRASETRSGLEWKGIGIHGTHEPHRLGSPASEGCVRLANEDLEKLLGLVAVGTTVTIRG